MEMPKEVGPFRVIRELGHGGMGTVFLAEDPRLGRKVALKILLPSRLEGSEGTSRLLKEAKAAAKLEHPSACAIFEVGESTSGAYIAMQYVEGETIEAVLTRSRPSLGEVVSWGVQIAETLAEAHRLGIIHRDIKPQNLMVTPKGQVKVLDFGLAKVISHGSHPASSSTLLTQEGMVMGTVPYMSPEQVRGDELDGRSDIFSLASVLFEAATGRRAFPAHNSAELMSEILKVDPFWDGGGDSLPTEFQAILAMGFQKNKADRYTSAEAMASDLRVVLADLQGPSGGLISPWLSASGSQRSSAVKTGNDLTAAIASSRNLTPAAPLHRSRWRTYWLLGALGLGIAGVAFVAIPPVLARRGAIDSIAILPVVNVSKASEAEYLCNGLSEGLINELARHPRLKVIGLASATQATAKDQDIRRIGQELGVGSILQTRLTLDNGQLELNSELVDARTHQRLWGQRYSGRIVDLWTLQETLLKDLAGARLPDLAGYRTRRDRRVISGDAYELFLKGNAALAKYTPKDIHEAFAYYDESLRRAPQFAEPVAAKARGYFYLSGYYMPHLEALSQVKKYSMEALRLDPNLPEAQTLLAYSIAVLDHDYRGADLRYQEAVKQSPSSPKIRQDYGTFLASMGHREEAKKQFDIALQLDPISLDLHCWTAVSNILGRDPDNAIFHCKKALQIDPKAWFPITINAWANGNKGDWEFALRELNRIRDDSNTTILLCLGLANGHLGRKTEAEKIAFTLINPNTVGSSSSNFNAACIYLATGDGERALRLLEKAILGKEENVLILKSMPELDILRGDDHFKRLLALAGQ